MKLIATLLTTALLAGAVHAATPTPDAAQVKAAHDLLAAMQAEKMMRMTAGMSKYASPEQRKQVMDKVIKLQPEFVYTRLATPVAKLLSTETSLEMTRFYQSSYGQKILHDTYNSGARLVPSTPKPTAAEQAELLGQQFVNAPIRLVALVQEVDDDDVVGLPVAVAAPDPLLDPLGVPRQVIIDDLGTELQVNALGCGFGRNHNRGVVAKFVDQRAAQVDGA